MYAATGNATLAPRPFLQRLRSGHGNGVRAEQVDAFADAIVSLPFPGRSNIVVGRNIGLRPGNMDLALSNDFLVDPGA